MTAFVDRVYGRSQADVFRMSKKRPFRPQTLGKNRFMDSLSPGKTRLGAGLLPAVCCVRYMDSLWTVWTNESSKGVNDEKCHEKTNSRR